jgi:hypothetical protein
MELILWRHGASCIFASVTDKFCTDVLLQEQRFSSGRAIPLAASVSIMWTSAVQAPRPYCSTRFPSKVLLHLGDAFCAAQTSRAGERLFRSPPRTVRSALPAPAAQKENARYWGMCPGVGRHRTLCELSTRHVFISCEPITAATASRRHRRAP